MTEMHILPFDKLVKKYFTNKFSIGFKRKTKGILINIGLLDIIKRAFGKKTKNSI